jgi:DNA-binding NarL/FixJ family response regulator
MTCSPPDDEPDDPADASPTPPAFLFSDMEEEINNPHAPGTVFTGERLKANRPDVYQGIVSMLGQGVGVREISRRLRVHHRTVQAVSMREGQT